MILRLKIWDKTKFLAGALALCLLLSGCAAPSAPKAETTEGPLMIAIGGAQYAADSSSLRVALQPGETAMLEAFPALRFLDATGSADPAEIAAWARAHQEVDVSYTVRLPDGTELDSRTETVELSACTGQELEAALEALGQLQGLKILRLGELRDSLPLESVRAAQSALPETEVRCGFTLYGKHFDVADASLNLRQTYIDDEAEALEAMLPYMPRLHTLDLDNCGLSNARLERLRLDHPELKVVWRVWFGRNYSVRTDVERILASRPTAGGELFNDDVEQLYYCHDVKYLDIGHNGGVTDISFVRGMPKLEVAILAMGDWSDASPLADCPELEYLEMQTTKCSDLSPLSGLTKLRHLNIATNLNISDISPLYSLTELERLWVGNYNYVTKDQIAEMQRCAPNCWINTTVWNDPTVEQWRFNDWDPVPRYALLRLQFGDYADSAYSFSWNDPLYSAPLKTAAEEDVLP